MVIASKSKAENELEEFESVFFGLSHEARRRVLVVLMARGGRMTAGEIVERFKCSWPTMTRQMQTLEKAKAKEYLNLFLDNPEKVAPEQCRTQVLFRS